MGDILQSVIVTAIFLTLAISPALACTYGEYQCQAGIRMQCTCDKHGCVWKNTGDSCSSHNPRTSQSRPDDYLIRQRSRVVEKWPV